MSGKDMMTIKEMSELTGIGVNTIQRKSWRKNNSFPADRVGRQILGYRPLVEKWMIDETNGNN